MDELSTEMVFLLLYVKDPKIASRNHYSPFFKRNINESNASAIKITDNMATTTDWTDVHCACGQ